MKYRMKCTNRNTGETYIKHASGLPEATIAREVKTCNQLWPHIKFEAEPIKETKP